MLEKEEKLSKERELENKKIHEKKIENERTQRTIKNLRDREELSKYSNLDLKKFEEERKAENEAMFN
jgi:hypothetical protein